MKKQIIQSAAIIAVAFALFMNAIPVSGDAVVVAGSSVADAGAAAGHVAGVSRIFNTIVPGKATVITADAELTGHTAGASRTVNLINTETVSLMENEVGLVAEGEEGAENAAAPEAVAEGTDPVAEGTDPAAEGTDPAAEGTDTAETVASVGEIKDVVNAADETATEEAPAEAVDPEWKNKLMVDVEDYLYVREQPSTDAEVVGKLRKGDVADVLEVVDGWYKITSGNVEGYVFGDYSVINNDAAELASQVCTTFAVAREGGLRVRSLASTDGDIVTTMGQGDKATVDTDAEAEVGWVAVSFRGLSGYVNEDYVDLTTDYGEGITVEEEQAAIEAERKAEEERRSQQVSASTVAPVQNAATAASFDEVTLLAALIQAESGNQPIEGQISVGAVVMNRMRSGGYPNTMYEVIYQRGQFGPAGRGTVAAIAANGPKAICIQAAQSALAGMDYTGGATHFLNVNSGHAGVVIGAHVFW
ncbi:MAG: SH3 domain-containing protein [Lachnospiraceae bacterium]|nr:SH3 domain-containing protein [Lachnospiraceae bacterium]